MVTAALSLFQWDSCTILALPVWMRSRCHPLSTLAQIVYPSSSLHMNEDFEKLFPEMDELSKDELALFVKTLETILTKAKEKLKVELPEEINDLSETPEEFYKLLPTPDIDAGLVTEVKTHLKDLPYRTNSRNRNSPDIFLYGSSPYRYNEQSANLQPTPLTPIMSKLLAEVNTCLGSEFNSMLVNKYKDLHSCLAAHKDDEACLDPTAPIATLSLGATRRLAISLNANKKKTGEPILLTPGSIFCMLPGFQERFYHAILPGRKYPPGGGTKETGVRYSITFRRITGTDEPNLTAPTTLSTQTPLPVDSLTVPAAKCVADTLVFGSSLTKGLDVTLLSKHSRQFKVYTNSGAQIADIRSDVEEVVRKKEVDVEKVKSIFFICGGNDVDNHSRGKCFNSICNDLEDLIRVTREAFPNAKLNIFSLIPRKSTYRCHISNMLVFNEWLEDYCKAEGLRCECLEFLFA
jgi:alkylated DNA repair dioxygenase AlkB